MATITTINASDNISDSREDINTNFSNLNTDKLESSDITGKEDVSNKKTSLADNSDTFYPSQKAVKTAVDAKQDTLVSGTNIKTVNSTTLLGSGDLAVQETLVSGTNIKTINSTSLLGSGNIDISGGSGDVIAPASNTDNNIPQWDGNNSKTLKDGLSLVTTIGTPGADTSIPTEQAVREAISGAGGGDVSGPASSTDNAITRFDGETGKIIQNSGATIDDSGNIVANNIASGASVSGSNTGDQDLSGYVAKSTYDAHTILQATTDNTPVAITIGEQTVVGRATGGNITALSIDSDLSSVSANDDTIPSAKATKSALDGKLANVVEDTTPQLGGQLDVNGNAIGDGTLELLKFEETASAVNEITIKNAATGSAPEVKATGDDTNIDVKLTPKGTGIVKGELHTATFVLKDKDTSLTTGTSIGGDFRIPGNRAITVKKVGAYVDTAAATGSNKLTIDINEAGTSILSTKITLDVGEKTSETATTAPVISDASIAANAILTFDIDQVNETTPAKGLKVYIEFIYT